MSAASSTERETRGAPPRARARRLRASLLRLATLGSLIGGGLASGCGDGASSASPAPPSLLLGYGDPFPLPECGWKRQPCEVRDRACAAELAAIAACLRGNGATDTVAPLTFLTEAAAESYLEARLEASPRPDPDRFEIALTQFGLTVANAFAPAERATTLAAGWTALYRNELGDIAVIEHPSSDATGTPALDQRQLEALVLHELIHALQDRDRGLGDFAQSYERDSDGTLRGMSVVEGEADWYEQRFYAALSGQDVTQIDWAGYFESRRESTEAWLFTRADLYSSTLLRVPYSHGASYVYGVWSAESPSAVRALFDTPPANMRDLLASFWGGTALADTAVPDRGSTPAGLELDTWTTLGAWNLYLLLRPRLGSADPARQLALDWRGDRFEVFGYDGAETAARWTIDLADADAASQLVATLADSPQLGAQRSGNRVQIITASTDPPPASLTAFP